jgi:phage terminase large subunit-like protein
MAWDLSCLDWEQRLRDGRSLVPDLPIDLVQGDRAVSVYNKLRLADVPGTPKLEEAGGDWFRDIVRALFGSLVASPSQILARERMIRELFLLVPKKNSKTTNGALLMLTALLLNERPQASLIMTAPVQDVAQMAFDAAAGAIRLDSVLERKLHIKDHLKTIVHRETKAELAIMSFDPAALTGQKPIAVLIDELHVVAKMPKAKSAIRQLRGGMLPFPEAFMAFITTQSEEAPVGAFKDELQKARAIRDGTRKGPMLPVLYEFPEDIQRPKEKGPEPWRDSSLWHMVTPNVGRSITIPRLVEEYETARDTSQEELRAWASQHLNIEIGLALKSDCWSGATFWEAQGRREVTFEYLLQWSEVIDFGVDGGGLDDLLGAAAIGRHKVTHEWLHWAHAWAHESVFERRKDIAAQLQDFADEGSLTIVERVGQDCEEVAAFAARIEKADLLDKVGVDTAGIGAILDELEVAGVPPEKVVGVPQNFKLAGAIKTVERKLAGGMFHHGGTALMNWCCGNARIEVRGNAIYVTKMASGLAKIDPLMATYDAASLMSLNPAAMGGLEDFLMNPIVMPA